MSYKSEREVLRLKLTTIPAKSLRDIARQRGIQAHTTSEAISELVSREIEEDYIDKFIRQKYAEKVKQRQNEIADEAILKELQKVQTFQWGVVQGQLDNKIQVNYVRRFYRYEELIQHVRDELYDDVQNYVICTWYNHWTTVIIEDIISTHPNVIPTIKNIKGVDLFFGGQPFDLKVTYLPQAYQNTEIVTLDPHRLAIWLYENQGAQRFGADNRLYVVVHDTKNPNDSWKIKRDIAFIRNKVDEFFSQETVTKEDELVFKFQGRTYTAVAKVLLIVK